jgi:hypothetical protein
MFESAGLITPQALRAATAARLKAARERRVAWLRVNILIFLDEKISLCDCRPGDAGLCATTIEYINVSQ